jgi:hypothetical protein
MDDSRVFDAPLSEWAEVLQDSETLGDGYHLKKGEALFKSRLPILPYTHAVRMNCF